MFKMVAGKVLRYGAVYCLFGIFGVFILMFPWFKHSFAHGGHDTEDGPKEGGNEDFAVN